MFLNSISSYTTHLPGTFQHILIFLWHMQRQCAWRWWKGSTCSGCKTYFFCWSRHCFCHDMQLSIVSINNRLNKYLQIQQSMESSTVYDLFFVVELGGLQYRKYIVQFPQSHCDTGSACGATHVARVVKFKKKNVSQWKRTGRKLLPVLNECYKLMFDQETNLLHSITDRQVLLQYASDCHSYVQWNISIEFLT